MSNTELNNMKTQKKLQSCKGYADSLYRNFLNKHRKGNPGNYKKYFEKTSNDEFKNALMRSNYDETETIDFKLIY